MERKTHPEYDSVSDDELRRSGQLVDEGPIDEEKDLVADEAEEDPEPQPAEEAAVRVEDEDPPGATDGPDSYVGKDSPEG